MFVWFSIFHLGSGIFPTFGKFSTVGVDFFQLLVNFPLWEWNFPNFWFSKALLLGSSSKAWLGKE